MPGVARARGDVVEAAARTYLLRAGLRDVAANANYRLGELDLVMREGASLVFVEVRYRRDARFGGGAVSVDARKQQRLTRLATAYLKRHDLLDCATRFDVVAVTWPGSSKRPVLEHYKDAFEAVGAGGMYS